MNIILNLTEKSDKIFENLKRRGFISEKQLKYFRFDFKNSCNLGKLYFLPKIHKRLSNVPGRPVVSNCGTPTEKVSEFLDNHLQPIMRKGLSYIKDSGDFINKIRRMGSIPDNAILVTADVTALYRSIPHDVGLKALRELLEKREQKKIPTEELVQMAEFVLKNNFFEFNGQIKQQISGTAIGTKYAPTYACIYMDKMEEEFLEKQEYKPFTWLRYIDESIPFLDLRVTLSQGKLETDLHIKPIDRQQYLHYSSSYPGHTKRSIVYSQTLRVARVCSHKADFRKHTTEMKSWFLKRGYPNNVIEKEMKKV